MAQDERRAGNKLATAWKKNDVLQEFERAVAVAPNDLNALASLAQMNAAFGHPEAAIEPIQRTLANDPRDAGWYSLLSLDLMAVGRLDEAIAQYEEAVRLLPAYAQAQHNLRRTLVAREQRRRANP